jgi:hypothetical protein
MKNDHNVESLERLDDIFQGLNFSSHKPHFLDPGGSANTAMPLFLQVPYGANLQGPKLFSFSKQINADPISPVGFGLSNTAVCQAKLQGSPRNIFQKCIENQEIQEEKDTPEKINNNPLHETGRNMQQITRKRQFLPNLVSPNSTR